MGTESSPASSATQSSEVKQVDDSIVDVFGPANAALPKPAPKRKGPKAQRGMYDPFTPWHCTDIPVTPSRKKSRTPRSRSSTAELDVKPDLISGAAEEEDDQPGDCIVAIPSPQTTRDVRAVSYDLKPAPRRGEAGKSGFITSASRWMSRLPALGTLFSPSRHGYDLTGEHEDVNANQEVDDTTPKDSGRKRKGAPQLGRSYSQPELGASAPAPTSTRSVRRKTAIVRENTPAVTRSSRSSKRTKVGSTQSEPVIVVIESDGEDELLLSPESAKQRKAEERRALSENSIAQTQSSTGRFDGTSSPSPLTRTRPKTDHQMLLNHLQGHFQATHPLAHLPLDSLALLWPRPKYQPHPPGRQTMPDYYKWFKRLKGKKYSLNR